MKDQFTAGDTVRIHSENNRYDGKLGTVTSSGYRVEVVINGDRATFDEWELKLSPKLHDLVRVRGTLGVFGAQEGYVTDVGSNGVRVEFAPDSFATFHSIDLTVIDQAPAKRAIGKAIESKDVKIGDKISVQTTDIMGNDVQRVTVLTAIVGKIVERGLNKDTLTFQTTAGHEFYSDSAFGKRQIVLLESIEEDPMFKDLSAMGPGSIIVFANKPGAAETDMAIKQPFEDQWHLVDGSKDRKPRTVGLVSIIKKKGVPYSVIRLVEK